MSSRKMKNVGLIVSVVCVLLTEGFSIPVDSTTRQTPVQPAGNTFIGQEDAAQKAKTLSSLEDELKSQMADTNQEALYGQHLRQQPQLKPIQSIGKITEHGDGEKEKLSQAFDNYIVDELDVDEILKNALTTLRRHPEILKELIEEEERKLADELSPYTHAEGRDMNDQMLDFQRSETQQHQFPKQAQKKNSVENIPYQEFKDAPVDVSHPESMVQYAEPQAVPFDFSMLPLEGGIDDPIFLDTSEQSLKARNMMHDTQAAGARSKNKMYENMEEKMSKKNEKPKNEDSQNFITELDNGLGTFSKEEKDHLFSFFPPKFQPSQSVSSKLSKKPDQTIDEKVVDFSKSQNMKIPPIPGDSAKMDVSNGKGTDGNTVSDDYMMPNNKFVLSLPEADFLEKLRLAEQEAENNLKFDDLEFPSNIMFNKAVRDDANAQLPRQTGNKDAEKQAGNHVNGANAIPVIKRSDEDDLQALAGLKG